MIENIGGIAGIDNNGTINNRLDGFININNANNGFVNRTTGVLTNDGTIQIDGIIFTNNATGFGIANDGGNVTNNGHINIGTISSIGLYGIRNLLSTSMFVNNNTITIGGGTGSIGSDAILLVDGTFHNNPCASIFLYDNLNNPSSMPFTNDGYIYLNTPQTHVPGLFINNGAISDPQGTFPTAAPDFNNNGIVVSRTDVNYCPDAISPAIVIGSLFNYFITGVYSDPAATTLAGTFDVATNTFVPNVPLSINSARLFFIKLEEVSGSCPIISEWPIIVLYNETIVFTGAGDGVNWFDPQNWDQGVIPSFCYDVVIPPPFTVDVIPGQQAQGRSLCVQPGAFMNQQTTTDMVIQN